MFADQCRLVVCLTPVSPQRRRPRSIVMPPTQLRRVYSCRLILFTPLPWKPRSTEIVAGATIVAQSTCVCQWQRDTMW